MKRIVLLSVLLSVFLQALPQQKMEVEIGVKNMSKGPQMAISVLIPEAKLKDVEDDWKLYINNRSMGEKIGNLATQFGNLFRTEANKSNRDRLKVDKKDDELYVRSIEVDKLTKYSIDVYARITEQIEGCLLSAFFQFTDSVFINESNVDAERLLSFKSYIRDFGVEAYKDVVDKQIKAAKDEVEKQEDVLKEIESDTKKAEKSITGNEVDIQEYENNITEIEGDIKQLEQNIAAKKLAFASYKKGMPDYDVAKSELKEMAKEKSKNFRKIKSFKGKIKSREQDIKSSKNTITVNEQKVTKQQAVIEEKVQIVEQLQKKKEEIK